MTKLYYAGLTAQQVVEMAPKWATHVTQPPGETISFLFESKEFYQAVTAGVLQAVCEQSSTMEPYAVLLTELEAQS